MKKYSKEDYLKADHQLNVVYAKIRDNTVSVYGSVTKEGVRKTQRRWIAYRDAWVVFGSIKCPGVSESSWKTMITKERIHDLQFLVENQY